VKWDDPARGSRASALTGREHVLAKKVAGGEELDQSMRAGGKRARDHDQPAT